MDQVNKDPAVSADVTDAEFAETPPELDGSVDALVSNLRAAKAQLADLLAGAGSIAAASGDEPEKRNRSAA